MKITHSLLLVFTLLFISVSCSSAPDDTSDIIVGYSEEKDSVDTSTVKLDSINGNNNPNTDSKEDELPDTVFKLEEYFQLHRGNNYAEGAAICGDYLFQASLNSELHIYNFSEKKYVTSIKLPSVGHADTMCFGTEKVEENDEFPVLYISGSNAYETGGKGTIYVYRLLREKDEQGTENWSGILIQRIKTPDVAVIGSYPDIVIDEKENCMWIIGCPYGKPTVSYKGIDFVDVKKQQLIANVDLAGSLINEAEAAVVVNDELYLVGQKSYVYKCIELDLSTLGENDA